MTLLERAYQLIANPPRISDYEGDGGVHPNDYRAAVQEWVDDYENSKFNRMRYLHNPGCVCEHCTAREKLDPIRGREMLNADKRDVISKLHCEQCGELPDGVCEVCGFTDQSTGNRR